MKFENKSVKFKGVALHVTGEYTPWTYEEEHMLNLKKIGKQITYSTRASHFDDYSEMFFGCPELIEQLKEYLLPIFENEYDDYTQETP